MCDIVSHFITSIRSAKKNSKETRIEGENVALLVWLDVFVCTGIRIAHLNRPLDNAGIFPAVLDTSHSVHFVAVTTNSLNSLFCFTVSTVNSSVFRFCYSQSCSEVKDPWPGILLLQCQSHDPQGLNVSKSKIHSDSASMNAAGVRFWLCYLSIS